MLKGIPIEERRKRDSTSEKITNEEIEQKINTLTDLLTLADYMYSQCHQPAGSLSDQQLEKSKEIIETFSTLWRNCELVSTTRKAHNIEKHLFTYLQRFRGLKEYDESFMERDHQRGVRYGLRSANVRAFADQMSMHSSWERLESNPRVVKAIKEYNSKRRKRRTSERVLAKQVESK